MDQPLTLMPVESLQWLLPSLGRELHQPTGNHLLRHPTIPSLEQQNQWWILELELSIGIGIIISVLGFFLLDIGIILMSQRLYPTKGYDYVGYWNPFPHQTTAWYPLRWLTLLSDFCSSSVDGTHLWIDLGFWWAASLTAKQKPSVVGSSRFMEALKPLTPPKECNNVLPRFVRRCTLW